MSGGQRVIDALKRAAFGDTLDLTNLPPRRVTVTRVATCDADELDRLRAEHAEMFRILSDLESPNGRSWHAIRDFRTLKANRGGQTPTDVVS